MRKKQKNQLQTAKNMFQKRVKEVRRRKKGEAKKSEESKKKFEKLWKSKNQRTECARKKE